MINVNFFELEKILLAFSSVSLKGAAQLSMAMNLVNLKKILFNFATERDSIIKRYFPEGQIDENNPAFPNFNKELENLFKQQISIDFSLFEKINITDIDLTQNNNQNYLAVMLELGLIAK